MRCAAAPLVLLVILNASAWATTQQSTNTGAAVQKRGPAAGSGARANVLKAICASEFGQGDLARVDVYRNARGAVALLALRPDINRFTHAPHTYFAPDGTSLLVVPERPVTPAEVKNDPVLRKQTELLRDLMEDKPAFCSDHR